jgi:hypothetical protein
MPFKSKAQQRFMFAAEDRGDLPKGTAKGWAEHTPSIKKLPEHAKKREAKHAELLEMAFQLGVKEAMEKSGIVESALSGLVRGSAHLWGPAALGAYAAGPDNRAWGAGAGMALGSLGKRVGRGLLRSSQFMPEELALLQKIENVNPEKLTPELIQNILKKHPGVAQGLEGIKKNDPAALVAKIQGAAQQVPMAEWAGRLGLAGVGGHLVSKMGPGGTGGTGGAPPGYLPYGPSAYAAPAVSDMSAHYMGFTPNG